MESKLHKSEFTHLPVKEIVRVILQKVAVPDYSNRQTKRIFSGINQIFKIFLLKKGEPVKDSDSLMLNIQRLMNIVGSLNKEDKQIVLQMLQIIEQRKQNQNQSY